MEKRTIASVFRLVILAGVMILSGSHPVGAESPFAAARTADANQLVVTVDGSNVHLDWSAMVAADSYTLALALVDSYGNIDTGSLVFIDVGDNRSLSASGLPGGKIFCAVILAHLDYGRLRVSNSCRFTSLAGVSMFPADGILMRVDDPGGAGTITIRGSIDGEHATIGSITGDDGSGPFVLTVIDDNHFTLVSGGVTLDMIRNGDSVTVQKARNQARSVNQEVSDCKKKWEGILAAEYADYIAEKVNTRRLLQIVYKGFWLSMGDLKASGKECGSACESYLRGLYRMAAFFALALANLEATHADSLDKINQKLADCDSPQESDPGGSAITGECAVPPGAVRKEIPYSASTVVYYELNGVTVGPWRYWKQRADGSKYLDRQSCNNAAGKLDGWAFDYFKNGNMRHATFYINGVKDGHEYLFFCDGLSVWMDKVWANGTVISSQTFNMDGELCSYWYADGDGSHSGLCSHYDDFQDECE